MSICAKCGLVNTPDSKYCKQCGTPLAEDQGSVQPLRPQGEFDRKIEDTGRRIGDDFRDAGEQLGSDMDRRGKELRFWWDRKLGIFAPVLGALFGIIVFIVAIFIVGMIGAVSDHPTFWNDLADFMEQYYWLFFALIFYGAFQGYFHFKYHSTFKWINPIMNGVGFVAWSWILAQVLHIGAVNSDHPRLYDLSDFIEDMLLLIFFLVVIVGYMIVFFGLVSPANWDKEGGA